MFFVRGSLFLAAFLFVWWFALIEPLMALLRLSADLLLRCLPGAAHGPAAQALQTGDWIVRVPVPSSLLSPSIHSGAPSFRGVQLQLPQSSLILFALGFPIFWALILANPGGWTNWKVLLRGTASIMAIALIQIAAFILHTINSNLHLVTNSFGVWLLDYLYYIDIYLFPYAAPFCVALATHPELRVAVLGYFSQDSAQPKASACVNGDRA